MSAVHGVLTHMTEQIVNITTREVAEIARVDASTVRRWAEAGELVSKKTPGGHYRFEAEYIYSRFGGAR